MSALTILIIRHAEKPLKHSGVPGLTVQGIDNKKSLTIAGWQRAGAWAALFGAGLGGDDFPRPTALYAANPDRNNEGDPSQRPAETIMSLADRLGLVLNDKDAKGEEAGLVVELLERTGVTLVCWEHHAIVEQILPKITNGQNHLALPGKWDDARFDVVLRFDRSVPDAPWSFRQLFPRLMKGDSDTPLS